MNEFELIERFFSRPARSPSVRLGVGDDAALLAPSPGCDLVAAVDMLVGGRHFLADTDPERLGRKALAHMAQDTRARGALLQPGGEHVEQRVQATPIERRNRDIAISGAEVALHPDADITLPP